MSFLVRYRGGYALEFLKGMPPRAVIDADATKFESQDDAARAIARSKFFVGLVEIEAVRAEDTIHTMDRIPEKGGAGEE